MNWLDNVKRQVKYEADGKVNVSLQECVDYNRVIARLCCVKREMADGKAITDLEQDLINTIKFLVADGK